MENNIKKYFNVLRINEDLSYGGLRTLKIIEDEFDNMNRALAKQSNENGTLPIPDVRQLLIDFCEIYAEGQFEDPDDIEGIVDWYLKVKDN